MRYQWKKIKKGKNNFPIHKISEKKFRKFYFNLYDSNESSFEKKEEPNGKKENESSDIFFLDFMKEIKDEIKMVEWPTLNKLFRQFVIVVLSLVFSALMVFSVDGFFASASKFLFEGKS